MIPDGVETADLKPAKLTPTSCMYSLYDLSRPEPKLTQRTQLKKKQFWEFSTLIYGSRSET